MEPEKNDYSGIDRRLYQRLPASIVEYSLVSEGAKEKSSFAKDVSLGGVCILISEKIELNTILSLKIYLPTYKTPVEAKGIVVWMKKSGYLNPKDKHYDIGVKLIEIEENDRDKIYEYSQRFSGIKKKEES